ncbi:phage head closure protein [Melissococcus plutonius]|uniref:phage head closure protein n=4 Tax=Melissococcus plutonius TaxID=33970 RepID=UPI0021E52C71|nr:phage head closure protein [Melissococcus plutonius]MCV2498215.1 phage head closure protein [Melissococcus plutonius]MCV2506830.1 phage head closure protein [Melissococcus plutonius]MCV2528087.1 phage head closure protein [Melissococcus plutonius]
MKKVNPSRLTYRVKLGYMEDKETPSGISKPTFVDKKEVWCSLFSLSTSEIIQLLGTEQKFSTSLLIRHLKNGLADFTHVEFQNAVYQIASYHPDADDTPKSFDMLVLKVVDKNG